MHTPETREKIRMARKNYVPSLVTNQRIGDALRGRNRTADTKAKISAAHSTDVARARTSKQMTTHGKSKSRAYVSWDGMKQRCFNLKNKAYFRYGGRGIAVCVRWLDFANFYADMGERPDGKTLDRINVDGNYERGNCRWATPKEQTENRRTLVTIALSELRRLKQENAELRRVISEVEPCQIR